MEWNWNSGGKGMSIGSSEVNDHERPEVVDSSWLILESVGRAAWPTRVETRSGGCGGKLCIMQKVRMKRAVQCCKRLKKLRVAKRGCEDG